MTTTTELDTASPCGDADILALPLSHGYDVPAGFSTSDECAEVFPTLRHAVDAALTTTPERAV